MRIAYIQKANFRIGQVIDVHGKKMKIESYSHTGKNVVVHTLPKAARFERVMCIVTDAEPIIEVTA